ncbi:MAG: photoactive yellow protein [Casimicrobium sp.]
MSNNAHYQRFFQIQGHDAAQVLDMLTDQQLDQVPFGAIKLDKDAKILRYNRVEGEITGRDPRAVIGRNFFLDLAACGVGPLFWGRYKQGIMKPSYDEIFPYVFYHEMPETAMLVRMTLSRVVGEKSMWIMVRRIMPSAQ